MKRVRKTLCAAVLAGSLAAMVLPATVYADPCEDRDADRRRQPHCTAPEVPVAALYPALGAASFAAAYTLRGRRFGWQRSGAER